MMRNERAVANMAALDTIMNYDATFHSISWLGIEAQEDCLCDTSTTYS